MKNVLVKQLNKNLLTVLILTIGLFSQVQATPLPNGTLLIIEQGLGSGINMSCASGSCFSVEVAPGMVIWTDLGPGTDGGIIVGNNQVSGGQEQVPSNTLDTPGEITNAWYFFGNYGTFYTTDAASNTFSDISCDGDNCVGNTELNNWMLAWNGSAVETGSANDSDTEFPGCTIQSKLNWNVLPGNAYAVNFTNSVNGGNCGFGGPLIMELHLEGQIILPYALTTAVKPAAPTTADVVSLDIKGEFPTSGYVMGEPNVTINGNLITVDLLALSPFGPVTPAIEPFSVSLPLGTFNKADYQYTVNLYIDAVKHGSAVGAFTVHSLLADGTLLTIKSGTGSGTNSPCITGSCFGMEVTPGVVIWTDFGPGTDGGIIVGKNQASGEQELAPSLTNDTPGEMTAAWNFFTNFGTFYTPAGSTNVYSDSSCVGAGCLGVTYIKSLYRAWNGVIGPLSSENGLCHSSNCTADQLAGIFVDSWTVNPDRSYALEYSYTLPDGDCSGCFGNVRFTLHMEGQIILPYVLTAAVKPDKPTVADVISLDINGEFPTSGYAMGDPYVTVDGNQVTVDLFALSPFDPVITPATEPFTVSVPIGTLASGDYTYRVRLFIDAELSALSGGVFDVFSACVRSTLLSRVTLAGSRQSQTINDSLKITYTGRIVEASDRTIKVCANTKLHYEAVSTIGFARCRVGGRNVASSGTINIRNHRERLSCTNKPAGSDTDRYRIKPIMD